MGRRWKIGLGDNWLHQVMVPKNFDGALRVYGWSFYSQGTSEDKQASSDFFIDAALRWFGEEPTEGESPWEKGRRLADAVRKERTLLILDGLEPLQNAPGEHGGALRDAAIQSLICELAAYNPGLCVLTTRYKVENLNTFAAPQSVNIPLEKLSDEAGAYLLESLGVDGERDERERASGDFGGHALALTLLGSYLCAVYDGDIRKRENIRSLMDEPEHGGHARRVMASYEDWFIGNHGMELSILRMMGLFDRPAPVGAIDALRAPAINGITSALKGISDVNWQRALANLRKAGLLGPPNDSEPDTLDCHPLVRDYFGDRLKRSRRAAWREGHTRLFAYYRDSAKEFPDTLDEMMPLYSAIMHGCAAELHQEAFNDVYWRRIRRGSAAFSIRNLGAFGADLSALSTFFAEPWTSVAPDLAGTTQAFVFSAAGYCMRALGRTDEALQPMLAGLEQFVICRDWTNAATAAKNVSEVHLAVGHIAKALILANRAVELAHNDSDRFAELFCKCALANTQAQRGHTEVAYALFAEAEQIQECRQSYYPLLYSYQGYQYCDLLINFGDYDEVICRATYGLEGAQLRGLLLDAGLDGCSLGRALAGKAAIGCGTESAAAKECLDEAVHELRRAGSQDHLPRGLLARAELYRLQPDLGSPEDDLQEAERICQRCDLRLLQADCHLEYARFHLAQGETEEARKRVEKARVMINEMGYHRRDKDLAELDEQLSKA